ncbi:hypothetical protein SPRG_01209 [Saprolegnia parasitica CBS 223.65]|uniref:Tyrosinase copper-binding domain-containing protein n=1 Tax=Saprolegnia parasitica (strain CBS 223.65) TaxID=695850 RepID=A0A067D814_SAPPC|nr:hypothetical protein SPRG_01209 [Saprolegnia parasitica CBS 223.65]KDO35142.1 hypothetical protein SPRG_01209 [Saprolegnia parasitica CBS 223.65]|eukprot:XP_012194791.1 hypothetical protein SPRG_01209 [Saprolegnia parasitica CBS 223.65]
MLRFAAFAVAAVDAADQCCFKDGDVISLRSDTGNYIGRCDSCVSNGAYKDSVFVHVKTPASSPWAQWTVVNTGNGKIALRADSGNLVHVNDWTTAPWAQWTCKEAGNGKVALQADSGKYLSRCNNSFVLIDDWTTAPWAQWTCKEAGDGKVALQADSGKFLARCNNCVGGAYPDTAMVHAKTFKAPTSAPTSAPTAGPATVTPAPTTTTPTRTTVTPAPTTVTPAPTTETPVPTTATPVPTSSTPAPTTSTPSPTTDVPTPTTVTPVPTPVPTIPATPAISTETPTPTPATTVPATDTPVTPMPLPTTESPLPTTVTPAPTTVTPAPTTEAPTTCTQSRVRKSWSSLSDAEKTTYKSAIALAMDSGLYQRFLSMHYDQMGNMQAHNTCVFIYWHRQFLVGFENMLRSLKPAFACVTIPYFDYINDNTKYMAGTCTTMNTCSPILNELGSATAGMIKSVTFGGSTVSGRCDASFPLDHFNENEGAGTNGAKCVPRGSYTSTYFPVAVGYTSIRAAILGDKDVSTVNTAIEGSAHNYMHNALGGAMTNPFVSPADPIFYSHHATIDALNAIYYKCRVASQGLTDDQKQSSPLSFQGCSVNGSPITATSSILMRAIIGGQTIDVHSEASTKAFFKDVPTQYYQLTDNTNLGVNSYSYEFEGLLGDLYTNCGAAASGSLRQLTYGTDDGPMSAFGHLQNYVNHRQKHKHVAKYTKWRRSLTKAAKGYGWTDEKVEGEIFKVVVSYYYYCLPGSVTDLSDEFKALWHVSTPSQPMQVLSKLLDGSDPIQLAGWEDINHEAFGCRGDSKPAY